VLVFFSFPSFPFPSPPPNSLTGDSIFPSSSNIFDFPRPCSCSAKFLELFSPYSSFNPFFFRRSVQIVVVHVVAGLGVMSLLIDSGPWPPGV